MAPVCGIDLGTTNSSLCVLRDGIPEVIPIDGSRLVPSVVGLDQASGRFIVGQRARRRAVLYPEYTVRSVKRHMGRNTRFRLGPHELTPEEISAKILSHLKGEGEKAVGEEITQAVITVPAYFDDDQRRATIRAGELAGIHVSRIINEPTAASLAYEPLDATTHDQGPHRVLVFDLGGGTFDVSILKIQGQLREVLASRGDTHLGGDDFDRELLEFLLNHIKDEEGVDLSRDKMAVARLLDIAERAKITLSSRPFAAVKETGIAFIDGRPINLDIEISRHDFQEMISPLVESTFTEVEKTIQEAGLEPSQIDRAIMVGGSSRIPAVIAGLKEILQLDPDLSIDPELCVAMGAAVQAGIMEGEILNKVLIDITAHSLGIRALDGSMPWMKQDIFSVIIPKNTPIPTKKAEVYYTTVDNQKRVQVEVFQGESLNCDENALIGRFKFDLRPAPRNSQVVVEFSYDLDGIVHVVVDQKGRDNRKEVSLSVRGRRAGTMERQPAKRQDYLQRKAQKLLSLLDEGVAGGGEGPPADAIATRLARALAAYSDAKGKGMDEEGLEEFEEALLDAIEDAEEAGLRHPAGTRA